MKLGKMLLGGGLKDSLKLKGVFTLGFLTLVFLLAPKANAQSSYWKNYFSSEERKAVQKNAEKYTREQIESKSTAWKGLIRSYNIKNGTIEDDDIKENGIGTDKISGLGDYIDQKISGSSTPQTPQDFSADNLTGSYAALDGSQITDITPANITGSGNLNIGNGDLFVDDASGNVGIGTASPGQQLEITRNFKLPTTTTTTGIIYQGNFPFIHTYSEPMSDGSNIFVGLNAGNLTMSTGGGASSLASNNIGVGYGTLHANTTGWRNTVVGISAMQNNTTGDHNIAFGQNALLSNQTGVYNTALGIDALHDGLAASYNVAVGQNALLALDSTGSPTGLYNVAVGFHAAQTATSAYNNTIIGASSMTGLTTGFFNTAVGYGAMNGVTTRYGNTAIGYSAGPSTSNVFGGVFLGYGAGRYETGNNTLYIDNATRANTTDGRTKALVYGIFDADPANQKLTFNANVGIGTTTPAVALDVNGQVKIQKSSSQPFACDMAHDATLAVTSAYRTCICKGTTTTWVFTTDGTTTCTW